MRAKEIITLRIFLHHKGWLKKIGTSIQHGTFQGIKDGADIHICDMVATNKTTGRTFHPYETYIHELTHFLMWAFFWKVHHNAKFKRIYNFLCKELLKPETKRDIIKERKAGRKLCGK